MYAIKNLLRSRAAVLVLSAAAAFAGFALASALVGQARRTADAVVAAADVPPYHTFSEGDIGKVIAVRKQPAAAVPRDAVRDPKELVGRTARSLIPADTPVRRAFLAGEGKGGSLARTLRDAGLGGAFSWQFPATEAVAGRISAGDRVDLVGYVKRGSGQDVAVEPVEVRSVTVLDAVLPSAAQQQAGGSGTLVVVFDDTGGRVSSALIGAVRDQGRVYLRLLPAAGAREGGGE